MHESRQKKKEHSAALQKEKEKKRKKKQRSLLAFSQTLLALGDTSSMRDILSLVSFPIYYSQLRERHWWRDQQQSLTIYPWATPSYSCAKETLITHDSGEALQSWQILWKNRALIFRAGMDSTQARLSKRKKSMFDVLFRSRYVWALYIGEVQ